MSSCGAAGSGKHKHWHGPQWVRTGHQQNMCTAAQTRLLQGRAQVLAKDHPRCRVPRHGGRRHHVRAAEAMR